MMCIPKCQPKNFSRRVDAHLAKSGSRDDLMERLRSPRPPLLWIRRQQSKLYVPRHNVASTALLVALYLHEQQTGPENQGMTKDELYVKAEELNITKNPFAGGTTQTGPHHYDGWSSMRQLLNGDPALVVRVKGSRYKLTRSRDLAGFEFGKVVHQWCHESKNCPCGNKDA